MDSIGSGRGRLCFFQKVRILRGVPAGFVAIVWWRAQAGAMCCNYWGLPSASEWLCSRWDEPFLQWDRNVRFRIFPASVWYWQVGYWRRWRTVPVESCKRSRCSPFPSIAASDRATLVMPWEYSRSLPSIVWSFVAFPTADWQTSESNRH